jgi:hypothetical protein
MDFDSISDAENMGLLLHVEDVEVARPTWLSAILTWPSRTLFSVPYRPVRL